MNTEYATEMEKPERPAAVDEDSRTDRCFNTRRFSRDILSEASTGLDSTVSERPMEAGSVSLNLAALFIAAINLPFEDGVESEFSKRLLAFVKRHGPLAVACTTGLILNGVVNEEVSAEALRWLGRMDDELTRAHRLWLLERCLSSKHSTTRRCQWHQKRLQR